MKKVLTSILALSLIAFTISFNYNSNSNNVFALTYSDNVGLNFTFNPSITVSLSSSDLVINDLTPGSSSDSNVIIVNVLSNNKNGYTLEANVGNSTTYDTRNLIMSSGAANFASIDYGASLPSLTIDNTWGYSYSNDNNTWTNYDGLPKYDDTTNIATLKTSATPSASTGDSTWFKIGAKASTTQTSGEYNNVINFIASAEPSSTKSLYEVFTEAGKTMQNGYYKMQDMTTTLCNQVTEIPSELQMLDIRDNKVYWVAKLADGKCWMTQNLDLDLSTNTTLTSNDTDLTDGSLSGAYAVGYTNTGGVISWTPATDTVNAISDESTSKSFTWPINYHTPVSMDPGNWYWKGTYYSSSAECPSVDSTNPTHIGCNYIAKPDNNKWATYFSTSENISSYSTHDHVGNYYNWPVAIASNSSSSLNTATDTEATVANSPQNSICPKGWRLPTVTTDYTTDGTTGHNDFYNLNYLYNGRKTNTDTGLIGAPTYFVRGGYVWPSYLHGAGYGGVYWSSSVSSSSSTNQARYLAFNSGWVYPQYPNSRYDGRSVRCIAR